MQARILYSKALTLLLPACCSFDRGPLVAMHAALGFVGTAVAPPEACPCRLLPPGSPTEASRLLFLLNAVPVCR